MSVKAENAGKLAEEEMESLVRDVDSVQAETEKEVSKAMGDIDAEMKEAHGDAKSEVEEIKEEIRDGVKKHSRVIAAVLYLFACVRCFLEKQNDEDEDEEVKVKVKVEEKEETEPMKNITTKIDEETKKPVADL